MKHVRALFTYLSLLIWEPAPPLRGNTDTRVLDWLTEDFEIN